MQETQVWSLGQEDPLEEEVATLPGEFHQTQLSIDRHIHCNGYIGIYVTLTNNKSYTRLFSSVHFGRSVVSDSLRPHGLQHARPPRPSPTPRVYSNLCPLSQWCHPTISSSVNPFSFCLQSFPASGSFEMSQFFASGGQSIGVSASASVLPLNIQDWFPLGWTG